MAQDADQHALAPRGGGALQNMTSTMRAVPSLCISTTLVLPATEKGSCSGGALATWATTGATGQAPSWAGAAFTGGGPPSGNKAALPTDGAFEWASTIDRPSSLNNH